MIASLAASVVVVFAIQACTPKGGADTTNAMGGMGAGGTMAGLDSLRQGYQDAYNRRDVAGIALYYTDDAVSIEPNGMLHEGRTAIQNSLPKDTAIWGTVTIAPTKPATISGNMAWEVGTYTLQMTQRGRQMTIPTRYLVLLQSDGSAWKIKAVTGPVDSAAMANAMKPAGRR